MHSFWQRVNTALTFFGSVAAVLCLLTTASDLLHRSNPNISVAINGIRRLTPYQGNKDQVVLTFDLDADLRSIFSWNTKQLFVYVQAEYETSSNKRNQVVLWDTIITDKDKQAVIRLRNHKTKYAFIDQGNNLRGRPIKLALYWNVMPKVGYMYTGSKVVDVGTLPSEYTA